MSPKNRFWWFFAVSISIIFIFFTILSIFFWRQLSPQEKVYLITLLKNNFAFIFIAIFLMLTGFVFALDGIFHSYIIPVIRLSEEVSVMQSVNPSHRIKIDGSKDVMRLVKVINEGADTIEALRKSVSEKIRTARSQAEEEKNLLASFMAELPQGVLICNTDGRIIFYNKRSRIFLEESPEGADPADAPGRFIGLGRSIFGVMDKNLIIHALDELTAKIRKKEPVPVAHFVMMGGGARLLRAEAIPILNPEAALPILKSSAPFAGYILILYDITRDIENERRVQFLLQSLLMRFRGSVAGIRSAIEAIIEYPEIDADQLDHFRRIIHSEALNLGDTLERTTETYNSEIESHWPLVCMPVADLLDTVGQKAKEKLGIKLTVKNTAKTSHQVRVDSYSAIMALLFLLNRLKEQTGAAEFDCTYDRSNLFLHIDLSWKGQGIRIETLRQWESQPLMIESEGTALTLKEVLSHHDAQVWCYACREPKELPRLRLFLPITVEGEVGPEGAGGISLSIESRPEYYDFDLFNQPGQNPELDNIPLTELTYTVFDTETTGLDPKTDEIISIGAVRIVNCRLLYKENFDQLVDPKRPLPYESIQFHGIREEMLSGQPPIEKALPQFHAFASDTILLGHNAAFDMRMLQMKEAGTGIRFINPVLDTLLLSAVLHPSQEAHKIEAIAERLGIRVVGRHTALGDAITTGEIFLKLLPLLKQAGLHTLGDARVASQKTYYARMKY